MKGLVSANLRPFVTYALIIMLLCTPLFFYLMKQSYTEDLDELIIYRADEFTEKNLSAFTTDYITIWNQFNEDLQIIPTNPAIPLDTPLQRNLFNKAEGHNINYRLYYTAITIEGKPYLLMSRIPMIEDHDLVEMQIKQYGLLLVILLFSLALVQRFTSGKLWLPFYDTLDKIKSFNIAKGNAPQFQHTNIREFNQLNRSIDELISDNLKKYSQQKEFIENASHELQTPISIFQTQLDILLQQPGLTEKHVEIIQTLYDVSSRMTRLNKNLLLLAKIDNNHYTEMKEADLTEIIRRQLFYLQYMAEDRGLKIGFDVHSSLLIKANVFLLESLVTNLIVNAIFYNKEEGSIEIILSDKYLTVSNTGDNKPLDINKLLQRFNQTSEENKKGNGLGLSIVHQICKLHGWQVTYDYCDNRHVFVVLFQPAKP